MSEDDRNDASMTKGRRFRAGHPGCFLAATAGCLCVGLILGEAEIHVGMAAMAFLMSLVIGISGMVVGLVRWRSADRLERWFTIGLALWFLLLLAMILPAL